MRRLQRALARHQYPGDKEFSVVHDKKISFPHFSESLKKFDASEKIKNCHSDRPLGQLGVEESLTLSI